VGRGNTSQAFIETEWTPFPRPRVSDVVHCCTSLPVKHCVHPMNASRPTTQRRQVPQLSVNTDCGVYTTSERRHWRTIIGGATLQGQFGEQRET
jgi:hypothetical protein